MGRGGSKLRDSLWSLNLSNHARVLQEKGVPLLYLTICFPEFSMRKIMNSRNCLLVIVGTVQTERVYTVRKYRKDNELFCL